MSPRHDKAKKAYHFLVKAEEDAQPVTLEDIALASGWSLETVKSYKAKNWHFFLKPSGDSFTCSGISQLTEDAFLRLQSQKRTPSDDVLRPRFTTEVDHLVDKARESALLAVQIYNNPLVAFRTPGYVVQMIIAFTALFHAIFERNGIEYWYKDRKTGQPQIVDGDKKAWELKACLSEFFKGQAKPEVANLKFFMGLRNRIEHRFVPTLDLTLSGKCQALLLNFEELLTTEFGPYFSLGTGLSLALQISSYPQDRQVALSRVQSNHLSMIMKFSEDYDATLPDNIVQSPKYSFRAFLIPKIGNHAKSSDVAVEFVHYDPNDPQQMAQYTKQVGIIRQIQGPDPGRHRPMQVVCAIRKRTNIDFSIQHHTNAWKLYGVRPQAKQSEGCKNEFCRYDETFKVFVYTDRWIEFLCDKISVPEEFERIRSYHRTKKKQRT